jgi:hypothetical protein
VLDVDCGAAPQAATTNQRAGIIWERWDLGRQAA